MIVQKHRKNSTLRNFYKTSLHLAKSFFMVKNIFLQFKQNFFQKKTTATNLNNIYYLKIVSPGSSFDLLVSIKFSSEGGKKSICVKQLLTF